MPYANNFQHAEYSRSDPKDRVHYCEFDPGDAPQSEAWSAAMREHGATLTRQNVKLVVFLHGAALGTDLFGAQRLDDVGGLKRGYSRGISGLDSLLSILREDTNGLTGPPGWPSPPWPNDQASKEALDATVRDAANFTQEYVETFRKAVNTDPSRPIHCERYLWSCEHHHLGRVLATCLFLEQLRRWASDQGLSAGDRILVWAHGQAGLLMALASNLLDLAPLSGRPRIFEILKDYAAAVPTAPISADRLDALEQALQEPGFLNGAVVDVATFGTPVRYGWDLDGIGGLVHVVNHRPLRLDGKRWLGKMELPQITMELPIAWGGDYIQQLAIAGTDARPATPEGQAANKAIWELVEPWDGFERWLECARRAVRCHNDGQCLIVDYHDSTGSTTARDHYFGHAAYTRTNGMLFAIREIVGRLYPAST